MNECQTCFRSIRVGEEVHERRVVTGYTEHGALRTDRTGKFDHANKWECLGND